MIEQLNSIFELAGINTLFGYILTIIILIMSSLGGLYIRNLFQTHLYKNKIVREYNFTEKKRNELAIRKIVSEIKAKMILYISIPIETPFNPKVDFDNLIRKLTNVIEENTYDSEKIRSHLYQILHLLHLTTEFDKTLKKNVAEGDNENIRLSIGAISENDLIKQFPLHIEIIRKELETLEY